MFAHPTDLEPGMWFRTHDNGPALMWGGVEPVRSRFAGKRRVRVHVVEGGVNFVVDASASFQLIDWRGGK